VMLPLSRVMLPLRRLLLSLSSASGSYILKILVLKRSRSLASLSFIPSVPCCFFTSPGRDNSFGRKRRDVEDDTDFAVDWELEDDIYRDRRDVVEEGEAANSNSNKVEIKEMFRVYESREIIPQESVCKNETTKLF